MSKILLLDIETNGLEDATTIWCIATKWFNAPVTIQVYSDTWDKADFPISELHSKISEADFVVGHNLCGFDAPTLKRLAGVDIPWEKQIDTLPLVQLLSPQVAEKSAGFNMPGNLKTSHSLAAWGWRLKVHKGDYTGGWDNVSDEMVDYCKQDVNVLETIYNWACRKKYPQTAINTEMELAPIINKIVEHGFRFNVKKAEDLYSTLVADRFTMSQSLKSLFPARFISKGEVTPTKTLTYKDPVRASRVAGASFTQIEWEEFNPNSRPQIVARLKEKYNWQPKEFTETGAPQIDETVLSSLDYPEAQELSNYFTINKRIAQLSDGKQGWLKCVDSVGRVHGKYMQSGTLTGRATHFNPNISQVPSPRLLYGKECRELFTCDEDKVLIGVDLASLELRCLAGYMKAYDKGAMIHTVLHGKKEEKTDVYSIAAESLGITRDTGKTLVLAMMYGAGDKKLAWTVNPHLDENRAYKYGKEIRENIEASLDGYKLLTEAVKEKLKHAGHICGLDGRLLVPRSEHSALNTLLQSAGAIISKRWVIISYHELIKKGYIYGKDFGLCAYCHDEIQIESKQEIACNVAQIVVECAYKAGEYYKFPCSMGAESKQGSTWHDTH